ncbi:MAG: hypothetical protein M3O70_26095 [Actinomycetota bacterium]|nr:hypothetical protein [Actinomycetota bacterium]
MWPRLANVALGVWLMVAPGVLGYSTTSKLASASDRIIGPLVVSAAIAAIWPEIRPLRWVNVTLGALAVLAPVALGAVFTWPIRGVVNSVVTGLAVIGFGLIRGEIDSEFGGGWRSVWRRDVDTVTGRRAGTQ